MAFQDTGAAIAEAERILQRAQAHDRDLTDEFIAEAIAKLTKDRLTASELSNLVTGHQALAKLKAYAGPPHKVFRDIVLYLPSTDGEQPAYIARPFKLATKKQLQMKLRARGFDDVAEVSEMPAQLLTPCTCNAIDVEDMVLQDGLHLAAVVDDSDVPTLRALHSKVVKVEQMAYTLDGWQRSEVSQQENEAGEWAAQQQLDAQQQDVHRFCFKQLAGKVGSGLSIKVELDGCSTSQTEVLVVERKPTLTFEAVNDFANKLDGLRHLIAAGVPNTEALQNKRIRAVFMCGDITRNDEGALDAYVRMLASDIDLALPGAATFSIGDSCYAWPPTSASIKSVKRAAQWLEAANSKLGRRASVAVAARAEARGSMAVRNASANRRQLQVVSVRRLHMPVTPAPCRAQLQRLL